MDDHGHGTHVAGIAAANGAGLKGVAPDANLYAYKVLAAGGYGFDSWILAAIERCVDPDQNPDTNDALHVVNMSLGRAPDANEPLSEAVNNAVSQGVVFVIAAGNSYDVLTIGTPGIAEKAITVGATDSFGMTAYFSSKGPVENTFALKPDVSAPGDNIYSSFKNGGYEVFRGTSMASPHVAGAAALLLERHPGWTPDMIKAALMNTAKESYEPIWYQGAGQIDVHKAINSEFIVTPGSICLGAPSVDPFVKIVKATIYNQSSTDKEFHVGIEGGILNSSISASISSPSFSLGAKSSREIAITFTVSTSSLPLQHMPECFSGNLIVSTSSHKTHTPITLLNPQKTTIKYEGELPSRAIVFGNHGNYLWRVYTPQSSELNLYLPEGNYDMITTFDHNITVVTEEMITDTNKEILISKKLAKNKVVFRPLDQFGNAIPVNLGTSGVSLFSGLNKNFLTLHAYVTDTFYISDNQSYRYDMKMRGNSDFDPEHYYDISATTGYGITKDIFCGNEPSRFKNLNVYNPSATDTQGLINYHRVGSPYIYMTTWNNYDVPVPNPLRVLISETGHENMILDSYSQLNPPGNESGYSWELNVWKVSDDNKLIVEDKYFNTIASFSEDSHNYKLGESLLHYGLEPSNSSETISFVETKNNGIFNRYYGEREIGTVNYKLLSNENLIKQGQLNNFLYTYSYAFKLDAPAQAYKMVFSYDDYQVQGRFGKATVELNFNTSLEDKNAPFIRSLSLNVAGKDVNQFTAGTPATIIAKIDDQSLNRITWQTSYSSGISSVLMYLKKSGSDEWISLSVLHGMDTEYKALLPENLTDGYYSLKLVATDQSDNSIGYEMNPAFLIGDQKGTTPYAKVRLLTPFDNSRYAGTTPLFSWSSMPSATYTFQLSETFDFTALLAEVVTTSNSYQLPDHLDEHKTYYWRVKANSQGTEIPWSQIFSFLPGALDKPTLFYPENGAINEPLNIQFRWSKLNDAAYYVFELSTTENFLDQQAYFILTDTDVLIEGLLPDTEYFWKVSTLYYTWDGQYYVSSHVNNFHTLNNAVTAIEELTLPNGAFVFPNPFSLNTSIVFHTKKPGEASLSILDPLGREVSFIKSHFPAGKNSIIWDGRNKGNALLPDGIYYGILRTQEERVNIKMIIKR